MKTKTIHSESNDHKQRFIEAVRLLAPGNHFIAAAARHVPPDILPPIAGVAALEFASTLDILCKSWRLRRPLPSADRTICRPNPRHIRHAVRRQREML